MPAAQQEGHKDARIVVVFNEKGGVGKTTVACNLAGALGQSGQDVLIADLDPQEAASIWKSMGGGENLAATLWSGHRMAGGLLGEIERLSKKFDWIVADCAPSVEQKSTWAMLQVADLILIPTSLSPQDIAALAAAKRLVKKAAEASGRNPPARLLCNRTRMHLAEDRANLDVLAQDKEIPPMKTTLGDRRAFSRSMVHGATAMQMAGGQQAAAELEALAKEVTRLTSRRA